MVEPIDWSVIAAIAVFVAIIGLAARLNLGTEQLYDRAKVVRRSDDEGHFRILQLAKMAKATLFAVCFAGAILGASGAINLNAERPPWVFSVAFIIAGLLLAIYAWESIYLQKIETSDGVLEKGDGDYWVLVVVKLFGSFLFGGVGLFMLAFDAS